MTNQTDALKASAAQVETVALLKEAKTFMARSVAMGAKFSKHNVNQAAWRVKAAIERLEAMSAALSVEQAPQSVAHAACEHEWFDCCNSAVEAPTKSCRKCGWTVYGDQEAVGLFIQWPWLSTPTEAPPVESQAAGWQPIKTADKDAASLMLGIFREGNLEEIHLGGYRYAVNEDEESCWWSDQSDDEIVPTHWMPPPPALASEPTE